MLRKKYTPLVIKVYHISNDKSQKMLLINNEVNNSDYITIYMKYINAHTHIYIYIYIYIYLHAHI